MKWNLALQGTYSPNMNAFWWVAVEIWTFEKLAYKTLSQCDRNADTDDRGDCNSSPCTLYRPANNPIWWPGGLVLSGCSNWDSGTNLKMEGEYVVELAIIHTCTALQVKAGFYGGMVEFWIFVRRVAGSMLSWSERWLAFLHLLQTQV